ncbi:MAG: energy-coupling factor ABC transporter permease [Acidobacteriota bacterium]
MLVALHIPDGFLSLPVAGGGWVLSLLLVAWALRRTQQVLGEAVVPLFGILAAFVFAAQVVNFPIVGGTSGHLLGAALAAVLLGPWAAVVVLSTVVLVQAVLFQDGGLLALGCNLLNMAVLAPLSAHVVYRVVGVSPGWRGVAAVLAGWLSVMVSAAATGAELVWSGTFPAAVTLPALLGVYAVVGLGEGLITAAVLAFLRRNRPALLERSLVVERDAAASVATMGVAATLGVILLAPLASEAPDGLEKVAEQAGVVGAAWEPWVKVFPDYVIDHLGANAFSVLAAVMVGTVTVFALTSLGLSAIRRKPGS